MNVFDLLYAKTIIYNVENDRVWRGANALNAREIATLCMCHANKPPAPRAVLARMELS